MYKPFDEPGFQTNTLQLDKAVEEYKLEFGVEIIPYDGSSEGVELGDPPRYFFYITPDSGRKLVDIHVERSGTEICPKQDLEFLLQDGDIVSIGALIC